MGLSSLIRPGSSFEGPGPRRASSALILSVYFRVGSAVADCDVKPAIRGLSSGISLGGLLSGKARILIDLTSFLAGRAQTNRKTSVDILASNCRIEMKCGWCCRRKVRMLLNI